MNWRRSLAVFARLEVPFAGARRRPPLPDGPAVGASTSADKGVAAPEGLALRSSK